MRPNMSYTSQYAIFGDLWYANALFLMEYNWKYRLHNGWPYLDTATVTDDKTTIEIDNTWITINNTPYLLTAGSNYSNYNILLFAAVDSVTQTAVRDYLKGRFKVYSLKIYNSWTPVRDFVPCYRIADTVIWLYDVVNDQFYTNAWSWTFTKWPNVN